MKYGLLVYARNECNIGDYYITEGVKQIYTEMGIAEEDIIYIDQYSLSSYEGEYVILPMAGFFDAFVAIKWLPLSPKIIPVFIGFRCIDEKNLRYMRMYKYYEPIGCRDEETMLRMRQNGLQAYVSGCMSLCIKKRQSLPTQTKIFAVDADNSLFPFIPENIKKDIEIIRHKMTYPELTPEEAQVVEMELAQKVYKKYRDEAKLVITSKLHCALPCLAMGVPVVFVLSRRDSRLAGMDKLLPVYTPEEYARIDWNGYTADIEDVKENIKNVAKAQIQRAVATPGSMYRLSEFFENREKTVYFGGFNKSYLSEKEKADFFGRKTHNSNLLEIIIKKKLPETNLIIWGAGDKGKWMVRRYGYDLAVFKSCIFIDSDENKVGKAIDEIPIYAPDILNKYSLKDTVIIVAANHYYDGAGYSIGCKLIKEYSMIEGRNFFFLDVLDESAKLSLSDYATVQTWPDAY